MCIKEEDVSQFEFPRKIQLFNSILINKAEKKIDEGI